MGLLEGLVGGAIVSLIVKRDGQEPVIVPVKVSGEGAAIPIPLPVTIVGGEPGPMPVGFVLESIDESLTDNMPCRDINTTYYIDKLLDARLAHLVLLIVINSGDQAVTVQVVGHVSNSPRDTNGLHNIGGTVSVAALDRHGFAVVREDYPYPWLGVTVATGASALTSGLVQVLATGDHWVKKERV